ncbi:MAG: ankyrin repeat domain-containing protein [Chlamydiales bacterium]|nr:ankyrin repeat domain-containing protein [Chlamydiales bacterium]
MSAVHGSGGYENQPPLPPKSKVVLHGSRKIMHDLASLSDAELKANIHQVSQSISTIYSQFKDQKILLDANDLKELSTIQARVKKSSGVDRQVVRKIQTDIKRIQKVFKTIAPKNDAQSDFHSHVIAMSFTEAHFKTEPGTQAVDKLKKHLKSISVDALDSDGNPALWTAASMGGTKAVRLLIEAGADVNYKSVDGTPLLVQAILRNKSEVVKVLLEHSADLTAKSKDGISALWYAAYFASPEIFKLLLEHGADPTEVNELNESLSYKLKSNRPAHWKEKLHALVNTMPIQKDIGKQTAHMKLTAHAFEVAGSGRIAGRKVAFTSGGRELAAATMAKSLKEFAGDPAQELAEVLEFASKHNSQRSHEILERIQKGKPTVLLTGYATHATTILIENDRFILCDRGETSKAPLLVYRFDPSKLSLKTIEDILSPISKDTPKEYKEYMYETLPKLLNFTQENTDFARQAKLPDQIIGNCTWASTEGIVKAYLFSKIDPKEHAHFTFLKWQVFQQMKLLDKYLIDPQEPSLVFQSFHLLWVTKKRYPILFDTALTKQLDDLEAKFTQNLTPGQKRMFKVSKALGSTIPDRHALKGIQGLLGTLSFIFSRKKPS